MADSWSHNRRIPCRWQWPVLGFSLLGFRAWFITFHFEEFLWIRNEASQSCTWDSSRTFCKIVTMDSPSFWDIFVPKAWVLGCCWLLPLLCPWLILTWRDWWMDWSDNQWPWGRGWMQTMTQNFYRTLPIDIARFLLIDFLIWSGIVLPPWSRLPPPYLPWSSIDYSRSVWTRCRYVLHPRQEIPRCSFWTRSNHSALFLNLRASHIYLGILCWTSCFGSSGRRCSSHDSRSSWACIRCPGC